MFCLFNDFGLKCLLRSTDMHEIDYTFLSLVFFLPFFPKVIWKGGGGGGAGGGECIEITWSEPYI